MTVLSASASRLNPTRRLFCFLLVIILPTLIDSDDTIVLQDPIAILLHVLPCDASAPVPIMIL